MGSIRKEITTGADANDVWSALRDVGALHIRLVPGYVVDTKLEAGARIVTFGNGMVVREPIVDVSDEMRRVVWSAVSERLTHYNGSAEVVDGNGETRVVWIADFLPDDAAAFIDSMMEQGVRVMKETLDRLDA
jgi:hypothetical protein